MLTLVADMNHQNPVNFAKLGKTGCVGVIHKASQGIGFTDCEYQHGVRRASAQENNLEWGAYEFNTGEEVKAQVTKFYAIARPDARTSLWLDLERNAASTGNMTLGQALEWMDRVDQLLGRRCGMYSGDVIKRLIPGDPKRGVAGATDVQRDFLALHPLWGCEYGPRWKNWDDAGHELPWKEFMLWQFTGDKVGPEPHTLDGLEDGADLSMFKGTPAELRTAWPLPSIQPAQV